MFGKYQKKIQKKNAANIEKASNINDSEDSQNYNSENNNNNNDDDFDSDSENGDQNDNNHDQYIIEEEEEPSLSDNSISVAAKNYSKLSNTRGVSNVNDNFSQSQSTGYIDSSELSVLKAEIQNRFDIHPNVNLPVAVEYSLGAISDRADIGCKSIHSNVEELSALTDEIIQKSKECNHLILKLNEYTVKVSKELRITQQSIQQIKVPRRSLLQLLMLFLIWIIDLFIKIYHKIESRNHTSNNS